MGLSANHDPSRNSSHPSGSTPQVLAVGRSTSLSFPFRGFRGPLLAKCSILYIKDRHIIRLEERFSPFLPPRKRPVVIGRFPSRQWGLLRLPFPFPSPFPFPLSPQADDDLPPPQPHLSDHHKALARTVRGRGACLLGSPCGGCGFAQPNRNGLCSAEPQRPRPANGPPVTVTTRQCTFRCAGKP